jgi:hypothetical protein
MSEWGWSSLARPSGPVNHGSMNDTWGSVPSSHEAKNSAMWVVWCRWRAPQNAVSGRFEK